MTRRKKKPQQPKRIQITDSEGWTHISRSGKKPNINNSTSTTEQKLVPSEAPKGQTLRDLQDSHAYYRDQWLSSPCHEALQKLLQADLPSTLRSRRRSSWWELVFLETFVNALASSSVAQVGQKHDELKIYVQDPVFNKLDAAFLESLGHVVLPSPEALAYITPSTFLFAPHLEIPVYMEALSGPKPRLCIGTATDECLDRVNAGRRDGEGRETGDEIFREYRDTTVSKRLPDFDRDPWTQFTCLYWITPVNDQDQSI
ncbi:MAG: hypothetical protein LQ346_002404 [Caloplaca aetnensis]|nr:MAG: hypothetical protein LQ346_002404 [Caloplaca aetnensis]